MVHAMKEITRLHVPSDVKYTKLVEDFMRSLGEQIYPSDENSRHRLSAVMNEVFTNIVKHSDTPSLEQMVRFQFEFQSGLLEISIYDNGPGIMIDDHYPPYPESLVGQRRKFREVIDGVVIMTILDTLSLEFSFDEVAYDEDEAALNFAELKSHGYGLSIITKIMDSVTYKFIRPGIYDWKMTKRL
ncbi:MAG: ATP-binding protein [Calditrichales bacterium]|nr:MAG: ATP-binding protein [Calditrichales bacterium]